MDPLSQFSSVSLEAPGGAPTGVGGNHETARAALEALLEEVRAGRVPSAALCAELDLLAYHCVAERRAGRTPGSAANACATCA